MRLATYFAATVKVFFVAPLIAWHYSAFAAQTSRWCLYATGAVSAQMSLLGRQAALLLVFAFDLCL
jgi:hypothetical protein